MKIKISVSTNKIGSTVERVIEVTNEDWIGLSEKQKNELTYEEMMNMPMFQWDWEEV